MRIRSFQGLRPTAESAARVVAPPYDVVTEAEARALAAGNPLSLLHVTRAEIDFPEGTDPYSDAVYERAVANFRALQAGGHLVRESAPCMYVYQQRMGDHVQQGIVALAHIDDYDSGLIKRHEKTRVDKENDRTRLTAAMSANAGPVFLTYRDRTELTTLMRAAAAGVPLYDIETHDGIRHTVWRVPGGEAIAAAFADVPCAYVADGHHRAASAVRVGRERRAANPAHTGAEDYNWFLCVLFPASQLRILPYNRLVRDLNGLSERELLERLRAVGPVTEDAPEAPERAGKVCFYMGGRWRALALAAPPGADPVSRLDVSLLQDRVLGPLLGIDDPRTSPRIEFAGGIRGTGHLRAEVDAGRAAIAFSLHPVSVEELMAIADAGQIMPPKSTWFEPKLRSGFFIHTF